jgi:hypothetical protein
MNNFGEWTKNPIKELMKSAAKKTAEIALCKANVKSIKNRLRLALDAMPDETVASLIKSSTLCKPQSTTGGKRKTRKHSRKQRKTRKH